MTPSNFRATLARLELTQTGAARLLGLDARTVRRYALGEREVPGPVVRLLGVMDIPEVRERLAAAHEANPVPRRVE